MAVVEGVWDGVGRGGEGKEMGGDGEGDAQGEGLRNAWEQGASGPTAICPSRIPPTPRQAPSPGATGHG